MSSEKQQFIIIFFFIKSEFINLLKWFKILLFQGQTSVSAKQGIVGSQNEKKKTRIIAFAPMFTQYRIAYALARKPYRIELLFTHKNGDFGEISVTERSCAAPISKMGSHISDRCSYYTRNYL